MACLCAPFSHVPAVRNAADASEKLSSTSEGRMALHKIATYVLKFFQDYLPKLFNNSSELALKLITAADSLFVGTMIFSFLGYFGHRKAERPHLEETASGEVVKNMEKTPYKGEKLTQFEKDARDKPFIAFANINYVWASITVGVSILENCSLKVLSTVSNGLGAFGSVGRALGTGVGKWFFFSGNVALTVASFSAVLHRSQHIIAHHSDKGFQMSTQLKLLGARVAILTLDILNLASRAVPFLAPIGIVAGLCEAWAYLKLNENVAKTPEVKLQDALYGKLRGGAK